MDIKKDNNLWLLLFEMYNNHHELFKIQRDDIKQFFFDTLYDRTQGIKR